MTAEFYEQRIKDIVLKIEKYQSYIEERQLTIHMLTVTMSEAYKQQRKSMVQIFTDEKKIQKEIGCIQTQIDFFEGEIETLREKQYYMIAWKKKCCGCELCNPPKTSANARAAAGKRHKKIMRKLEIV